MAISPLMIWQPGFGGTPVRAYRLVSGTSLESVQLGGVTSFTAGTWNTSIRGTKGHNRMVEFRGNIYLAHVATGDVYRYDLGATDPWVVVHSLASPPNPAIDQEMSGWHIINVDGETRLYLFYKQSSASTTRGVWTADGVNWNAINTYSNNEEPRNSILFKNRVYFMGSTSGINTYFAYNPQNDSWAEVPYSGTSVDPGAQMFGIYGDRLVAIGPSYSTARNTMIFKELVNEAFADASFSGGTDEGSMVTTQAVSQTNSCFIFEDVDRGTSGDNRLYVVFLELTTGTNDGANTGQVQVHEFIPNGSTPGSSWAENNISATVVPSTWRDGGALTTAADWHSRSCIAGYVQVSNPETPEIYMWRHRNITVDENSTMFTWNGNASVMSTAPSSLSALMLGPAGPNQTDEWVYTEGNFDVTLENEVVYPDRVELDFKVHFPLDSMGTSVTDKQGQLFYTTGGLNWMPATISTDPVDAPITVIGPDDPPTVMTTSDGTILDGITIGSSTYRFVWDTVADGFTVAGTPIQIALKVF